MKKSRLVVRQRGFTVIEMVISVALIGMLSLAIYGAASIMRRSYDQNTKNNYNLLAVKSGLSKIADELRYANKIEIKDGGSKASVTTNGATVDIFLDTTEHCLKIGIKSIAEPLAKTLTFSKTSDARIKVSMIVTDFSTAKITANPQLTMSTTVRMLNVAENN